jgi:hypothetical protein
MIVTVRDRSGQPRAIVVNRVVAEAHVWSRPFQRGEP